MAVEEQVRLCSRPTKSGHACRNPLALLEIACRAHMTDEDRGLIAHMTNVWHEGYGAGFEQAQREAEREALKRARGEKFHTHRHGRQVVVVGSYAYLAPHEVELGLGDMVHLPANWLYGAQWARVTSIGTDYDGELSDLLGWRRA